MRAWRLTPSRHAATAFSGVGASLYGGRWNRQGTAVVYLSSSLALATLEVVVHLTGGLVPYTAIEVEVPDARIEPLDLATLPAGWADDEVVTQRLAAPWLASDRLALAVPSVLVDPRAPGERNVVLNPASAAWAEVVEVQRFGCTVDARLV